MSGFGKVLVTGGGGAMGSNVVDELVLAGAEEVIVLDNYRSRPAARISTGHRANGARRASSRATSERSEARARSLWTGVDSPLPSCGDPDHAVRGGTAAGAGSPGGRHLQRIRGRGRARGGQGGGGLVASVYGNGGGIPHHRKPPPPQQRHLLWGREIVQRGHGPQLPRDVPGWTTSLLRYFNVYGPRMDVHGLYTEVLVRWMERIMEGQPPLIFGDGLADDGFHLYGDVARANILAAASGVHGRRLQRSQRRGDQPAGDSRRRCCGSWTPTAVEHGPERAVNGVVRRLADTSCRPRPRLRRRKSDLKRGCADSSNGGAAPGEIAASRKPARNQ